MAQAQKRNGKATNRRSGLPAFDEDIQFDSIDLGNESAREISNNGAGDVGVLNAAVGLSFIETAPAVLDITTVFAVYTKNNEFPAVDSRYVMVLGTAMAE